MMNTNRILIAILLALLICSCTDVLKVVSEGITPKETGYTIPLEDALSSLESFMIETGMLQETKGSMNDYIEDFFTVSNPSTKADFNCGDVLYVVNFLEKGGYALLSADSRIPDDIIAITDTGYASESDFTKPVFERIPSENDDLSVSEYDELVATGILAIEQNHINYECLAYAMREIETQQNDPIKIGSPCDPGPGGSGGTGSDPITYQWKVVKEVPRMLNTAWTQRTPANDLFNKYCPEVGLIWRNIAPAGCVCIALSQIIAFNEYPANIICNGMQIVYPEIKNIYSYDNYWGKGTPTSQEMLAKFCINVGAFCNTQYHSIFNQSWGFAWPWDAKSCLELFGYQNVSLDWGYDRNRILASLDTGYPVFMSAIRELWSGHAWVIDGYIIRDYVSNRGKVSDSQTLLHCNWGWHGISNGYFTAGIFNTDEVVISDSLTSQQSDKDYWYAFNTITYDIPQK